MSATKSDFLVAIVAAAVPAGFSKMASAGVRAAPLLGIPAVVGFATAVLLSNEKRADLSSNLGKVLESGVGNLERAQVSTLGRSVDFLRNSPLGQGVMNYGGKALTGLSLLSLLSPLTAAAHTGGRAALMLALKKIGAGLARTTAAAMAAGGTVAQLMKPQSKFKSYISNVFDPEGNARDLSKVLEWKNTVDALDGLRNSTSDMFGGSLPAVPDPYKNVVMKASQFAEGPAPDATIAQLIREIQTSGRPDAARDLVSLQSAIGMTPASAHLASVFGVALVANLVAKYLGAGPVGRTLFSMAAGFGLTHSPGYIPGSSMRRI